MEASSDPSGSLPILNPGATAKASLLDLSLEELTAWCVDRNLPRFRATQIFEWIFKKQANKIDDMTNLSKQLRGVLAEAFVVTRSTVASRQLSADGTEKVLLTWPDQTTSECVMIPDGNRRTACISTQVGCPVRCVFCASGLEGLKRQLAPGEIVEQVLNLESTLDQGHRITNVVFMGLGEPLSNYAATIKAVRTLNSPWGFGIGARKITISTVGLPAAMRRLAAESLQVTLALSLHAPNDALRKKIIPWAEYATIDELIAAARDYFDQTGREITLEYILLGELNDSAEQARELVQVVRSLRANVNLIRYNEVEGLPYRRPSSDRARAFQDVLRAGGVNAHMRRSRGRDIDAACGQLRRRHEDRNRPSTGAKKGENCG